MKDLEERIANVRWENEATRMKTLDATYAGAAAVACEYIEVNVPRPGRLELGAMEAQSLGYKVKQFRWPETACMQRAHATTKGLMVVDNENSMDSFLRNEQLELEDARTHQPQPCGSLAARGMALTCLCHGQSNRLWAHALDAMAVLASEPDKANACAAADSADAVIDRLP